ncbi:hypothetical protein KEJ45_02230 [Candidatus Bathyarchaeota archaeon]|nr:hypothetical protein [Candidatus Bathyarchaeota archaeon]
MAHKTKKTVSSLQYPLQKAYKKIANIKPSSIVLSVITIAVAIFLFGGGLYSIVAKPYTAAYYGGKFYFIYPQLSEQFVSDSVISTILYTLGIVGLAVMYQSTKYAYKPRQAYLMFIIGAALVIIAYASIEAIIHYVKGV